MAAQQPESAIPPFAPSSRRVTSTGLNELLDLSPDALVIVDQAGTIVLVNEQAVSLFGYRREEVQGKPLEMLLPERLRSLHTAHREHYFAEPRTRSMGMGLELLGRCQDGREFPVDISLRPVLLDNQPLTIAAIRDVSEQRRAERERVQQRAQIQLQAELIDLAHDAIFARDSVGRVTFWNKGAEALYGWSVQEALGRITHHLLQTRFPIDLAAVEAHIERNGFWEGELVHTCRDGRVVLVESRQALMRNSYGRPTAILEINREITRRRQLEQAAQEVHTETAARLSFLQQVLDALPSSVYLVYGPDARLMLANHTAVSLWGTVWPTDQPMLEFLAEHGIALFDAQGYPLAPEQYATLRAVQSGNTVLHQQETIRRPNGSSLPVLVSALALPPPAGTGQLASTGESVALVVHQDVSALKEAEHLKDEFIGVAAHELRNPIAALKGFATMLVYQTARGKGTKLTAWQQEALEEIEQATTRLDKLTEDLLDVTRLQAGRLALTPKPTGLVGLIRHMMAQVQMTTSRHTFSLATECSSLVVEIDQGRIEQVLNNLLGNAVKYSPQGGPIELTLREEIEPHVALLTIRDRGIGIPAHQQARIFGRFVRAENARASEITGTGLGLYLSRELVERHGGRLWFESTEGQGTTFFLTLPLVAPLQQSDISHNGS
jgi:PAS domain S-box-containing protein